MTDEELFEETIRILEVMQNSWKEAIDKNVKYFTLRLKQKRPYTKSYAMLFIDGLQDALANSINMQSDLTNLKNYTMCIVWKDRLGEKTDDSK